MREAPLEKDRKIVVVLDLFKTEGRNIPITSR